jgi:hypothetical protein
MFVVCAVIVTWCVGQSHCSTVGVVCVAMDWVSQGTGNGVLIRAIVAQLVWCVCYGLGESGHRKSGFLLSRSSRSSRYTHPYIWWVKVKVPHNRLEGPEGVEV